MRVTMAGSILFCNKPLPAQKDVAHRECPEPHGPRGKNPLPTFPCRDGHLSCCLCNLICVAAETTLNVDDSWLENYMAYANSRS